MSIEDLVFVDVETTGLDPGAHEVWEVALFTRAEGFVVLQREPTMLEMAEPEALVVNRFYERQVIARETYSQEIVQTFLASDETWARRVATATAGKVMVGIGTWFDARFLEVQLRRAGFAPAWQRHLICAKLLAVREAQISVEGRDIELAERLAVPPFQTRDVAEALGVDRGDAHTALADVMTAIQFYERAMGVDVLGEML